MNKLSLITAIVANLLSLAWRALTTQREHSSLRRGRKDPADEASPLQSCSTGAVLWSAFNPATG